MHVTIARSIGIDQDFYPVRELCGRANRLFVEAVFSIRPASVRDLPERFEIGKLSTRFTVARAVFERIFKMLASHDMIHDDRCTIVRGTA